MKFCSFDIVFQEIPGEVTLALNISGCPNRCKGCHSPHLQTDCGEHLTEGVVEHLLATYGNAVTCVCFMGGDAAPHEVLQLSQCVRKQSKKTAWYSGKSEMYTHALLHFDYIKIGEYCEELGDLRSATTNQRLYKIENESLVRLQL
jgi:anaerobic ribonucleoside-triphosphate reductase activating protein